MIMVIARGEFIHELEKNVEFRQRHAERAAEKRKRRGHQKVYGRI